MSSISNLGYDFRGARDFTLLDFAWLELHSVSSSHLLIILEMLHSKAFSVIYFSVQTSFLDQYYKLVLVVKSL